MSLLGDKYAELVNLIEAFMAGPQRSRDLVRRMESSFAKCELDDDDQFSDLQYAIAMYGSQSGTDEEILLVACRDAIHKLRELDSKKR